MTKLFSGLLTLLVIPMSFGQLKDYQYQRKIKGISQQWHKISLPYDVLSNTSQNLSDLRVFGITETADTIEVPFILQSTTEKSAISQVSFERLNTSHREDGYYFTFKIPAETTVNRIHLNFANENFDWNARLEGSNDLTEWFTILNNQRILSVKNDEIAFQYSDLKFSRSRYRYFRLRIVSEEIPQLHSAGISREEFTAGRFENYEIKKIVTEEAKDTKETQITLELQKPGRPALLRFTVADSLDYYRPITIKYLSDSIKTENGWLPQYVTLTRGVLNSMEQSEFTIPDIKTQKLKIIIRNYDNRPLKMDRIQVKGHVHELTARFSDPGTYYLAYGNPEAIQPHYDISHFTKSIPENAPLLELENEIIIPREKSEISTPLFINKIWLWAIMGIIMLTLGWFTVKMIQNKETPS